MTIMIIILIFIKLLLSAWICDGIGQGGLVLQQTNHSLINWPSLKQAKKNDMLDVGLRPTLPFLMNSVAPLSSKQLSLKCSLVSVNFRYGKSCNSPEF